MDKGEGITNPVELLVNDMTEPCCRAWGVEVRKDDRPCMYLQHLLTPEECLQLLETYGPQHDTESSSLEPGSRSQFSKSDEELSIKLWERIKHLFPTDLDGGEVIGLRKEWNHARYFPGQSVFAHMDQRQTSEEHRKDPCIASRMTLNVYLDEAYEGGEFVFVTGVRNDGSWERSHTVLHPKAGDAVLFYQGVPEFSHAVPPLKSGIKTIMRSDVMYRFTNEEEADVGGLRVTGGRKIRE
jgi:hypothetical protein